ncbi:MULTISPECIES: ATP-binding protein [Protofrankia]|uniref:Putative transcriptional regulator n=1 Tax=Candidatus Protofrankia datiscae TaxID=2716812 RepID=F8B6C2_9ACTN|nr:MULTISPECIES: ATP-binding protein [Protofrankia]AEH08098.1 putative transcriptional regulator [Candidatus Protofrankia datiscae]
MDGTDASIGAALARILAGSMAEREETATLDFKEAPTARGRRSASEVQGELERIIVDACLCFANGDGGIVVLGVADRTPGAAAFVGTDTDAERLKSRVYQLSQPPLLVDVRERVFADARLLELRVPRGIEVHADSQGRARRRIGTDCHPMSPAEIVLVRQERSGYDPSATRTQRTVDDVEPEALAACRRLLASLTDLRRGYAELRTPDLLSALGVTDGGKLTRAGEILLCRPSTHTVVYLYRDSPGGEPRAVERLDMPLALSYLEVLRLVNARRNLTPVTLPTGQQLQIEDFPDLAVREAVMNALVHRDVHQPHSVVIDHSPQILTVTSPGPLVSGITVDNILTAASRPRNPRLMGAVRTLGLSEETGRGVDRMYREMIRSGRALPFIRAEFDHVTVSMVGGAPNVAIARFVAALPDAEREDTDTLMIVLYLCDHENVTAAAIAPRLQRPAEEAESILRRLATGQDGLLDISRSTARRRYGRYRLREHARMALGTALAYRVRNADEIDRRVVEHVREYGWITNRTVQNLCAVDVYQARRWLADLRRRGLLVQVTEGRSSGPGIRYGPGPAFPGRPGRDPVGPNRPTGLTGPDGPDRDNWSRVGWRLTADLSGCRLLSGRRSQAREEGQGRASLYAVAQCGSV